jgi:hypothetical protein
MQRIKQLLPYAAALAAILLTLAAAPAAQAADNLWLHVHVDEGDGGATVRVNLPIAFAEKALAMVPADEMQNGRIVIEDEEITVAELRDLWASLTDAGDAVLVESEDDGERVMVRRQGGYMLVEVHEDDDADGNGTVNVRIPDRVIEAMLATDGEELDIAAGLRALAEAGEGELVTVDDGGDRVRVWVDATAESR